MVRIRQATGDDVPALLGMMERYWAFEGIAGFDPERLAPLLHRLCAEPHLGSGWIARGDGSPAGYLLAVQVFSLEYLGLTAEIDELFVTAEWRARGIGSELLRTAEAAFIRAGCTHVSLRLARGNVAARAFYRNRGYAQRAEYGILDKRLRAD